MRQTELDSMMGRDGRSDNGSESNKGDECGERGDRYKNKKKETRWKSGEAARQISKIYTFLPLSLFAQSRLQTASSILDASPLVLCLTHTHS